MRKHLKYLSYVLRHKYHVYRSGIYLGVSRWQLLIHDWSKFMPCEWLPYVEKFYGDGSHKLVVDLAFDRAWNHHQKFNQHHWQYWVLVNDSSEPKFNPLPMPEKYCREMVADWMGAGIAITGRMEVASWYGKNKDKIMLHESTRRDVELLISSIENTYRVGRMLGVETT